MKDIIIVSCYPDTEYKEFLLNECVKKLNILNKKILIASHYPIPDYITKKVDYYLYDKENIDFDHKTFENSPYCFIEENQGFTLEFLEKCHTPSLSRIFNLAINFVKHLQYDFFTIIESDSEYDISDLEKLNNIRDDIIRLNKKYFFFKLRPYQFPYWESIGINNVYETYCFGGYVNDFLKNCTFPLHKEDWINLYNSNFRNQHLEYYVTSIFENIQDESIILDSFRHIFLNSKVNLLTVGDPTGIYYNSTNQHNPVIFLFNNQSKVRKYTMRCMNNRYRREITLNPRCWWLDSVDISQYNLDLCIIISEERNIISRICNVVNNQFLEKIKHTRRIRFK